MTLKAGDQLDHKYWLLHALGQGGFGEVWLARDTVLGDHHVAIKFLTASSPEKDNDFLSRSPEVNRRRNTLPKMDANYPVSLEKIGQPDPLVSGYVGTYSRASGVRDIQGSSLRIAALLRRNAKAD